MVIIDPYLTSYGKLLNKEKTAKEIQKYVLGSDNPNLNYEYKNEGNNKLVFIVGYNSEEKELPVWSMPIIYKDIRNEYIIAVDLRKFVKQINEVPINLKDIMRDGASCNYLINTALVISDFLNEDYGKYRPLFNGITASYATFVSNIINSAIALDPVEKLDTEIAASYFINTMLSPSEDIHEYTSAIVARINNVKLSLPTNVKIIENTVSKCNPELYSLSGLISNIKLVLPIEKAELLDDKVFVNLLSNIWFGPGANETVMMAIENSAMWITLVYACLGDHTFKRAKLSSILDKNSRNINSKEYIKTMDLIIKERIIS